MSSVQEELVVSNVISTLGARSLHFATLYLFEMQPVKTFTSGLILKTAKDLSVL